MFKFFSTAAEKRLAGELVERLAKDVPPAQMTADMRKLSVNRITRMLERTYQAAAAHKREHGLGVVKRAVLANTFKWGLKERGYPDEFVEMATEGLVVELSKSAAPPDAGNKH
jgi:hypothetical protein